MVENNYQILGVHEGATKKEIRDAFRKLALEHHSDRGGDIELFKKIKQAYDDLKLGKKYPDSPEERRRKSKVYTFDEEEEIIRNKILAEDLSKDMKVAEEWASALNRANATGIRFFGSKTLGELEFERKANGALSIKGNYKAGGLKYDGPIIMQGNITSPSWSKDHKTDIKITKGDFKLVNPLENKYKIENGAKITSDHGDVIVGNVFGKKDQVQDPTGKVGLYTIKEHRTHLIAPNGKIVVENAANTVSLESDSLIILNMEDDVKIKAREILIYGHKLTYDVKIELKEGGFIRFFEDFSVQGLSDDAIIKLENGKKIRLRELKIKKIKNLPPEFVNSKNNFSKNDTIVGNGFTITYELLDNFGKKSSNAKKIGWTSKLGGLRKS
ncbi:MAG: J domain-containing protein [Thaumarchaeota archaeon]|nr:J domain-containing protein [Nitrososphaerota archaeon]